MKFLILALVVVCAHAQSQDVQIISSESDVGVDGYKYAYATSNGISAQEEGVLKQSSEYPSIEVKGSYSYTSPEGENVQTSYVADENGFQPQGSHIPVPPPIPEYILRSIKYIEAHPPPAAPYRNL